MTGQGETGAGAENHNQSKADKEQSENKQLEVGCSSFGQADFFGCLSFTLLKLPTALSVHVSAWRQCPVQAAAQGKYTPGHGERLLYPSKRLQW